MPSVGQITLITDTTAYCRVTWGKPKTVQGTVSFSVQFPTYRGESWQARKVKAIAEARRVAGAFLHLTDSGSFEPAQSSQPLGDHLKALEADALACASNS